MVGNLSPDVLQCVQWPLLDLRTSPALQPLLPLYDVATTHSNHAPTNVTTHTQLTRVLAVRGGWCGSARTLTDDAIAFTSWKWRYCRSASHIAAKPTSALTCTTGAVSEYDRIEETLAPVAIATVRDWLVKRLEAK